MDSLKFDRIARNGRVNRMFENQVQMIADSLCLRRVKRSFVRVFQFKETLEPVAEIFRSHGVASEILKSSRRVIVNRREGAPQRGRRTCAFGGGLFPPHNPRFQGL